MEEKTDVYLCLNCGEPIVKDPRAKRLNSTRFHNGCQIRYISKLPKTKECECGCKELINSFDVNGLPRRFKAGHWAKTEECKGEKTGNFGDYRCKSNGYWLVRVLDHPFVDSRGYYPEHRLVWEQCNKAILLPWGVVHHINHKRDDNRIENLEVMMKVDHDRLESYLRQRNNGSFI